MDKIQLKHPEGKHAIRIDQDKFEVLFKSIKKCLSNGPLKHKELFFAVRDDFETNNIKFEGSIEWYMESVKLDMEANKIIERVKIKSQLMFQLVS